MIIKKVNYTIEDGQADQAINIIREFIKEISINETETFYQAFRISDTNEFVHLMKFKNEEGEQKHRNALYTQKFVSELYPVCEEYPKFYDLQEIC